MSDSNTTGEVVPENPYHPLYSDQDATLILSSSDGVLFRVHPIFLRFASEVFRNMFSDAQDSKEPIQLEEDSNVLKWLLDLIYPNGTGLRLATQEFEFIWSLLIAADKYQIKKIMDEFQNRLITDSYFTTRPVESHVLACRFSWTVEIRTTSMLCIDYVNTPTSLKLFGLLDAIHVLRLHKLISTRNAKFLEGWNTVTIEEHFWSNLIDARRNSPIYLSIICSLVQQELSKYPSGKTIKAEFWDRQEITLMISNTLHRTTVKHRMLTLLNNLPTTVDMTGS